MPPRGGFIPPFVGMGLSFIGVVLSPQRGGFISPLGHLGKLLPLLGGFVPAFR